VRSDIHLQAQRMLRAAKLYCTKCRVAILGVLLGANRPLRQDEIAVRLGRKRPNKVTIYRTLESFCAVGMVHKAFVQDRTVHFELANRCRAIRCHPHFTCKNCGITRCLVGLKVPMVKGLKKGFVIHRQQVRLEGLCPACA